MKDFLFLSKMDSKLRAVNCALNKMLIEQARETFGEPLKELDVSLAADEPDQGKVASSLFRAYVNDNAKNKDMSSYFLDQVCATQGQLMRLFPILRSEQEAEKKYKVQFKGTLVIFEAHRTTAGVMKRVAERGSLPMIPEQYHVWRHELERRGAFFELPIHFMASEDLRARCDNELQTLVEMSVLTAEATYQETLFFQAFVQHSARFREQTYTEATFEEFLQGVNRNTLCFIKNGTAPHELSAMVFKFFARNGSMSVGKALKLVTLVTSVGATSTLFRKENLRITNPKEDNPNLPAMWTEGWNVGAFGEDWRATIEFNNMDGKPLHDPSVRHFAATQRFQSYPVTTDGSGNWGSYKSSHRTILIPNGQTAMWEQITIGDCLRRSGFLTQAWVRNGVLWALFGHHGATKWPGAVPTVRDLMRVTGCYDELRPAFLAAAEAGVNMPSLPMTLAQFNSEMTKLRTRFIAQAGVPFLTYGADGHLQINAAGGRAGPPLAGINYAAFDFVAPFAGVDIDAAQPFRTTRLVANGLQGQYRRALNLAREIAAKHMHYATMDSNTALAELNPQGNAAAGEDWLDMKCDDPHFYQQAVEKNLPVPLGFQHHRTIELDTGCALWFIAGGETGFGIPKYAAIFLTEEVDTNSARFSAHFQFGLVIVKHINLYLVPDVVPVGVRGGLGTEAFPMDEASVGNYKQSSSQWLDKVVSIVTGYKNAPKRHFTNLSGTMNEIWYSGPDTQMGPDQHYDTASFYKAHFGFSNDNDFPFARTQEEDQVHHVSRSRMISCQAHHLRYNSGTDKIDDSVTGFDFMGETPTPAFYLKLRKGAAIGGSMTSFTEPH